MGVLALGMATSEVKRRGYCDSARRARGTAWPRASPAPPAPPRPPALRSREQHEAVGVRRLHAQAGRHRPEWDDIRI
ncbi:hypothetical protein MSG28_004856 [Choristoneura fumiferana]|uniref:Uncharacterized protein n=1 Tax=Choristoneura fumiferana TaxID=7141 RepID=A0ACC0K7L9_CHOFU|nr:hypothetical protein MSG28_004856 [Choristoneura fumiferana]